MRVNVYAMSLKSPAVILLIWCMSCVVLLAQPNSSVLSSSVKQVQHLLEQDDSISASLSAFAIDERARQKRLQTIDLFHLGVGADAAFLSNWTAGAKLFMGLGSISHWVSSDIGIKYSVTSPLVVENGEWVLWQQLPIYLSLNAQPYRWREGCLYVGAEVAHNIVTTAIHSVSSPLRYWLSDRRLCRNHVSLSAQAGARWENWSIGLFYQYDLAPAINQKYVYESSDYDFDALQKTIYERMRVGISVAYLWSLNP